MKSFALILFFSCWTNISLAKNVDCIIKTMNVKVGIVMGNQCYNFPDNLGQNEERMALGLCNLPDNNTFKHTVTKVRTCPEDTFGRCYFKKPVPGFNFSYTIHYYLVPNVTRESVKKSCLAAKGEWL